VRVIFRFFFQSKIQLHRNSRSYVVRVNNIDVVERYLWRKKKCVNPAWRIRAWKICMEYGADRIWLTHKAGAGTRTPNTSCSQLPYLQLVQCPWKKKLGEFLNEVFYGSNDHENWVIQSNSIVSDLDKRTMTIWPYDHKKWVWIFYQRHPREHGTNSN
jgi:hypothetical protein